jgi:hypothetical protein
MTAFRYSAILILTIAFNLVHAGEPFRDGDLIFIENPRGQGKAIQLATGSKYTHVGIVFIENGVPMVYHAVEPVSRNTVREFVAMSANGRYETRRLKDQSLLSREIVSLMQQEARSKLGLHYDLAFSWDDGELYCSEFVWKLYEKALSIRIGEPRPLRTFDLSDPRVKSIMEQRYNGRIPLDEQMISPGDMYDSALLE